MVGEQGKYRICVVGFAHMHVNELLDRFLASGRAELIACADTIPLTPTRTEVEGSRRANLRRALAKPGAPRHYEDYREMLRRETLDLAIFCPEISRHAEVAEALAAHRLHMVTEKPIAATLADARAMARVAEAAGVRLAVNWPMTWRPAIRKAEALIRAQAIGTVWEVKWRNRASLGPLAAGSTHPGNTIVFGEVTEAEKGSEWWHQSATGGGALLDYCCYGACLAAWYLGAPATSVQGIKVNLFSQFGDAEDNAAMLIRFPAAMAVIEASWTTLHNGVANGPLIYGTHGTIVVDGDNVLLYADRASDTPKQVFTGDPLPPGRGTIAEEFLHHVETGAALHPTLAMPLNLATAAMLEAGARSAASGRAEPVETTA